MEKNNLKNFIKKKTNLNKDKKDKLDIKENVNFFMLSSTNGEDVDKISSSLIKHNSYESPKKMSRTSLCSLENKMTERIVTDDKNEQIFNEKSINSAKKETRYDFLLEIKDKNGVLKDHINYDPSSLYISESQLEKMTPFERQFWDIKKDYWDTIVFFKKGKFYELYEGDADIASKLFNFRVTDRVNMRMAGFPESTLDDWICKFLEAGFKVARVDQSENMIAKRIRERGSSKDKIIKRELKEIITQGTIYNPNHLKDSNSVYTLIIRENTFCDHKNCPFSIHFSVLLFDACTLKIFFKTFCDDKFYNALRNLCLKFLIKEYVSKKKYTFLNNHVSANEKKANNQIEILNDEENECYTYLYNFMKYLNREKTLSNCNFFKIENSESKMILDSSTIINMDILSDLHDKTLFNSINFCATPFGQRKLKNWMLSPLSYGKSIKKRQFLINIFSKCNITSLTENFKQLGDFERMFSKLRSGNAKFKDLKIFLDKLLVVINIYEILESKILNADKSKENVKVGTFEEIANYENCRFSCTLLQDLNNFFNDYKSKFSIIKDEIIPGKVNSGNLVKLLDEKEIILKKFNIVLDKEKTNINCKDIVFKNIGKEIFQIEIPKSVKVPDDFFLISATKTVNRFYTPEVKSLLSEFIELEEKIFQAHGTLFVQAVEYLLHSENLFFNIISDLSTIDCLISCSIFNNSIRGCIPMESQILNVKDLGNPIYKDHITNDYLEEKKILILTGSNMAGKSTFMRSLCLNTILFHIGLNVIASHFECPIFDKLFSRMGASDNLLRGESTFMIELLETSNILKNATSNSLVIIDELGRGTSTKDGECIAKAVLRELNNIDCTVFFSTHYHNLINSELTFSTGYMNSIIKNGEMVFLYKLVSGICKDSNGIYVAKLAGVPDEITSLAEKYKKELMDIK